MPSIEAARNKFEEYLPYYNQTVDARITVLTLNDYPAKRYQSDENWVIHSVDELFTELKYAARSCFRP